MGDRCQAVLIIITIIRPLSLQLIGGPLFDHCVLTRTPPRLQGPSRPTRYQAVIPRSARACGRTGHAIVERSRGLVVTGTGLAVDMSKHASRQRRLTCMHCRRMCMYQLLVCTHSHWIDIDWLSELLLGN